MAKNTVVIRGHVNIRDEKVAAAAITPGHLVERTAADKVQKHSGAGQVANKLFAIEDENQGGGIDDAYAQDATVKLWRPVPGERVYGIANGSIAVGDFVESAGDGTLRKLSVGSSSAETQNPNIIGQALTAAATTERFICEIF